MGARGLRSAGLLLYRRSGASIEVFLAHPGGPFWKGRDEGAWTIPKGELAPDEDALVAAFREFEEETGVRPEGETISLGSVRQKAGKEVLAWANEGDADPSLARSNDVTMEFPKGSGRVITFPEVDRCGWFDLDAARRLINPAQAELLDRLRTALGLPG